MPAATDVRRVLLDELIDDAGLFPPARLPMTEALTTHRATLDSPHAFLVGRFLCPTSRLPELVAAGAPARLGLVVDGDLAAALAGAAAALADADGVVVETVEARAPGRGWTADDVQAAYAALRAAGLPGRPQLYLEVADSTDRHGCRAHVALVAAARDAHGLDGDLPPPGAKLRCGGATPAEVPPAAAVATFAAACAVAGVPFKATAGLHHPVAAPGRHGFLNLLAATAMARAGTDVEELLPVLAADRPGAFTCTADAFGWDDHRFEAGAVHALRAAALVAIGSCSVAEPVDDLTGLGVLPLAEGAR
jgi:hypothetical protein